MKAGAVGPRDAEGGKQGQLNVPSVGMVEESAADLRMALVAVDTGLAVAANIPALAGVSVKGVDVCSTPEM